MRLIQKASRGSARFRLGGLRREKSIRKDHERFIARTGLLKTRERYPERAGGLVLGTPVEDFEPASNDAKIIEARVQAFSQDELHARFHTLVDQRFEKPLEYAERFELERIEARFDFEEQRDLQHVAAMRRTWDEDRSQLVASLERLLAGFRSR